MQETSAIPKDPNTTQIVYSTKTYDRLIGLVYKTRGILFDSIDEYFSENNRDQVLNAYYPTVIIGNHVEEGDVPALSVIYRAIQPKIKFAIPAREDILKKNFLVKEFRPKGTLRLIFGLIDKTNLIPVLLRYIGCFPVKRPFRDNARELLKSGELRNMVDQEWNVLVEKVTSGRNLFLFPEGTFNQDGYLNQIKRGVYFIRTKIKDIHFISFTLTYDYISAKKTQLHIAYGETFDISENASNDEVTNIVKEKLGKNYVVTSGNLLSMILMRLGTETTVGKEILFKRLQNFADEIKKKGKKIYVSGKLFSSHLEETFQHILNKGLENKLLKLDGNGEVFGTEKLLYKDGDTRNLRKKNEFLYHANQLTYHKPELDKILLSLT
ncbi:1-acyl-sn-glycerol-3-phosphate acyltransferase [Leptospira mayottensis]|uniref:Acyltransferase n=2 Tax=Leptospira mayottensis TaxID=1137606 RepID=A0AA87MP77_9LEPT|nr:1-acyl-sn-glycerol-3-phosphate acyltransferase [Leptospira mayottensis]AXR62741.1 1-acyl-sn-glycerol-3-phosphate acyltransferase [Leptospira mayottensis]AXR66365.1 1-acyl-sn-glycerol-3-phosphate acyltransferase [Leptospira mayottensis]AXR70147.1 1-acyl-sn-glycerol-3-phosphate acyltransferase [Leptospira mayottensis]AZQ04126.1 1-acyl-sn-glycerol-3-phosphate acyltransferase [Leptospira mayottensis 200901116]EKR99235.1 acyltransferase [Leptospira mayottensis 200901122]